MTFAKFVYLTTKGGFISTRTAISFDMLPVPFQLGPLDEPLCCCWCTRLTVHVLDTRLMLMTTHFIIFIFIIIIINGANVNTFYIYPPAQFAVYCTDPPDVRHHVYVPHIWPQLVTKCCPPPPPRRLPNGCQRRVSGWDSLFCSIY